VQGLSQSFRQKVAGVELKAGKFGDNGRVIGKKFLSVEYASRAGILGKALTADMIIDAPANILGTCLPAI